mgnify:CR=1 FL=1
MEQRKTPLLDAIVDYTTNRPVYFKIPGHRYEKGISPAGDSGQEMASSGLI